MDVAKSTTVIELLASWIWSIRFITFIAFRAEVCSSDNLANAARKNMEWEITAMWGELSVLLSKTMSCSVFAARSIKWAMLSPVWPLLIARSFRHSCHRCLNLFWFVVIVMSNPSRSPYSISRSSGLLWDGMQWSVPRGWAVCVARNRCDVTMLPNWTRAQVKASARNWAWVFPNGVSEELIPAPWTILLAFAYVWPCRHRYSRTQFGSSGGRMFMCMLALSVNLATLGSGTGLSPFSMPSNFWKQFICRYNFLLWLHSCADYWVFF